MTQLERVRIDIIFCNKIWKKENLAIQINNIDFKGLYKGKDRIFQKKLNGDEVFITKIPDYELYVLNIDFFL